MRRNVVMLWLLILTMAAVLTVLIAVGEGAEAKTITVDDSGGKDYTTIQDAVNASENGDTVYVYAGTYKEHVTVNKTINLTGEGADRVTINGSGNGDVVKITADWVNMSGFKVTGSGGWPWGAGIMVESDHNHIFENNCSNNNWDGIFLDYSSNNNTITNNTCNSNNGDGIFLYSSSNSTITNNNCSDNEYGIYLSYSNICILSNNTMEKDGIMIGGSSLKDFNMYKIDKTNTVNGKPVYYYANATGLIVPAGAGQVIIANCTDMIVENQNLSDGSVGIITAYSSYITITNNTCSDNEYGIYLSSSSGSTISNNNCNSNNYHGIYLSYSSYNTITNNTCNSNNGDGIVLWYSNSNTVSHNTCNSNNRYGIDLISSNSNTVSHNTCSNNGVGDNADAFPHFAYFSTWTQAGITGAIIGLTVAVVKRRKKIRIEKAYRRLKVIQEEIEALFEQWSDEEIIVPGEIYERYRNIQESMEKMELNDALETLSSLLEEMKTFNDEFKSASNIVKDLDSLETEARNKGVIYDSGAAEAVKAAFKKGD